MAEKRKKLKTVELAYIGVSAALITICSWISIPLTVPITLQTMGICIVAGIFGAKIGVLSTLVYILLGAIGVPVFSGFKAGAGVLLGSTGGYIIGFIFTSLIVGLVSDKVKGKLVPLILSMIAGALIYYTLGTIWFAVVYAKSNTPVGIWTILGWCVTPFIIPDLIKIILSALLTNRIKPLIFKQSL